MGLRQLVEANHSLYLPTIENKEDLTMVIFQSLLSFLTGATTATLMWSCLFLALLIVLVIVMTPVLKASS